MYTIVSGDSLSKIAGKLGVRYVDLLAANPNYKANPNNIHAGDTLIIPGQPSILTAETTSTTEIEPATVPEQGDDPFTMPFGQITFDAEGQEQRGKYFSRSPHVPGPWSGITIGRGYDLGARSANEIIADLNAAGVASAIATNCAEGRGYKGQKARNFIRQQQLDQLEITPAQQKALFLIVYKELEGDVIRICTKDDVVAKYGPVYWDRLHTGLRDITVDLRYRGDYTGATRELVQLPLVRNDLMAFKTALADRGFWVHRHGVPVDRFKRRNDLLEKYSA